ncbi:MAG: penicillin-insensitive murein endopeptidase [Alphaproteobacteria bacterium]|nr:penicillin-insensitive murein endopeptidase [Alphaproteobacteria bacterium]
MFRALLLLSLLASPLLFGNWIARQLESDAPSVSHGSPAAGSLENGKRLPTRGRHHASYSRLGATLGRTCVHERVRDTLLAAFAAADTGHTWVIGETGRCEGGPFPPHKTHQSGLSVDLFVPTRLGGRPARLPTWPLFKFGYGIELDDAGTWGPYTLDFEALAVLLGALRDAAPDQGLRVGRVIFAPDLQPELRQAAPKGSLKGLSFNSKGAWVRHDEHVHVDFVQN